MAKSSYLFNGNFAEVACFGGYPGCTVIRKFGHNSSVGTTFVPA